MTSCEAKQFEDLLGQSKTKIATSTDTITGINLNDHPGQRGVYKALERAGKIIIVQDTLVAEPVVRGMVVENGVITKTVGLGKSRTLRIKTGIDLMEGFLGCQCYFQTNPQG